MFVSEHLHNDTKILTLSGRLDRSTIAGLEAAILGAQEMGCRHLILNVAHVAWIDSAGLGKIFLMYHHFHPHGIRISLVGPNTDVKKILDLAHISELVPLYQSDAAALAAAESHM